MLWRAVVLPGIFALAVTASATPANKAALVKHYDKFLPKALNACTTCHLPSDNKHPETLADFPHNPFGDRLRKLGEEAAKAGKKLDIPHRLADIAKGDEDNDGVDNETELLLGRQPGNAKDTPTKKELADGKKKLAEWAKALASYRWKPFEAVKRPPVPLISIRHNSPFATRLMPSSRRNIRRASSRRAPRPLRKFCSAALTSTSSASRPRRRR